MLGSVLEWSLVACFYYSINLLLKICWEFSENFLRIVTVFPKFFPLCSANHAKMAVAAAAALLDELMGRYRNLAPTDKTKDLNWEDPEVSGFNFKQFQFKLCTYLFLFKNLLFWPHENDQFVLSRVGLLI